jgi:hypothetical protein
MDFRLGKYGEARAAPALPDLNQRWAEGCPGQVFKTLLCNLKVVGQKRFPIASLIGVKGRVVAHFQFDQ